MKRKPVVYEYLGHVPRVIFAELACNNDTSCHNEKSKNTRHCTLYLAQSGKNILDSLDFANTVMLKSVSELLV